MSVTVCSILKESYQTCIEFGSYLVSTFKQPFFDIIIVDNGISADARKYLEHLPIKVITGIPDAFDSSREQYLRYAKGDFLLILDADERLRAESIPQIIQYTCERNAHKAAKLPIFNYTGNGNWAEFEAVRLIKNKEGICYDGREMHSQLIDKNGMAIIDSADFLYTPIHHYDCLLPGRSENKRKRNITRLNEILLDKPEDAISMMYLGLEYTAKHEYKMAESLYKKALEIRPKSFYIKYFYMLLLVMVGDREDEAEAIARYLIENNKYIGVASSVLTKLLQKKNKKAAIDVLMKLLRENDFQPAACINLGHLLFSYDFNMSRYYYMKALIQNPEIFNIDIYRQADGPNLYECQSLIIQKENIFESLAKIEALDGNPKAEKYFRNCLFAIRKAGEI